ncbi:MAG: 2-phospho-L-lactate transferase [Thermoproteota archaeon]|nr:2-phospho-L-lactate transferase [Thermoproteota archaeon]
MTIAVLAGGTGSIKLVRGLAAIEKDLVVICNVGDNMWIHGLYVCPDIDTIIYGLANMLDQKRGWGIKGDSFQCLAQMRKIGAPSWFALGDKDLATHLIRTSMIKDGKSLSEITSFFRKRYFISAQLIPATDREMTTSIVTTSRGDMHLQEFWVKHKGRPTVRGIRYDNASRATANPAVIAAIKRCRAVVIAPANPVSSIGPIVALSDLRKELAQNRDKVIAISPLIGRKALSGPAVKYMRALGLESSSVGVAKHYRDFVSKFIISRKDHRMKLQIEALGMQVYETNITMKARSDEVRLGMHLLKMVEEN